MFVAKHGGAVACASGRARAPEAAAEDRARRGQPAAAGSDGNGRRCAEGLSDFQDELIRLVYDYTVTHVYAPPTRPTPSTWPSSRPAATAAACWRPSPTSICCSCCPTSRRPGARASSSTCSICCGTSGLKVGHATRTVDQSLKLARADITIRTALLDSRLILGDEPLFAGADAALPARGRAGHRARSSSRPSWPSATSATGAPASRATASSPTSRTARAACAICTPCTGWPSTCTARARAKAPSRADDLHRRRTRHLPPLRDIPMGRALPSALPDRARRRAADVRRAAGDGGAARLCRARRAARRRALHEALLPGRQGRRRSHDHPVLGARDGAGQDVARAWPAAQSFELAHAPPHPHDQRFPHRQRPAQRRRPRRLQARSRQPHPLLCQGGGDGCLLPSQRGAAAAPIVAPHRRQAAQRPGSQPHLPRDALLDEEPRADAAAHERSRRARPLHSRLRPRRLHDAVQHVPPLHGGRASDPHDRRPVRHRTRRGGRARIRSPPGSSTPCSTGARCTWRPSCTTSPRGATRTTPSSARASPAAWARAWA